MEGQKEFRRRIAKLQSAHTNNSENTVFLRIQNKVRILLQARNKSTLKSKVLVASGGDPGTISFKSAATAVQVLEWRVPYSLV